LLSKFLDSIPKELHQKFMALSVNDGDNPDDGTPEEEHPDPEGEETAKLKKTDKDSTSLATAPEVNTIANADSNDMNI
jgi:hypothetical protein